MFLSRFIVAMLVLAMYACSTEEPKKPTPTDDDNNNQSGTEVLTTSIVTDITLTTAKSGGSQINTASGVILSKGIVWNTSPSPTIDHFSKSAGEGYGAFVCDMTDLQPNTKYYVRAYITNQNGMFYGNEVSFTTYAKVSITKNFITNNAYFLDCLVEGGTSAPIIERGVLYNTSKQELSEFLGTKIKAETHIVGSFTIQLAHARVLYALPYVINETGVFYGSDIVTLEGLEGQPAIAEPAAGKVTLAIRVPEGTCNGVVLTGSPFGWNPASGTAAFAKVEGTETWYSVTFDYDVSAFLWGVGAMLKAIAVPETGTTKWETQWENIEILAGDAFITIENDTEPRLDLAETADGTVIYVTIANWKTAPCAPPVSG